MPLISRRWDKDQRELDRVFRGPKAYKWPICKRVPPAKQLSTDVKLLGLVSYSEATRYTPQKYLETVQWCKVNDKPAPKFTLYPRTKGFVTTVKELGTSSSVKAIYDLTLAYAHKGCFLEAPSMWTTLCQPNLDRDWRFHVHTERYEIQELIGRSDAELASWMEARWMEKSKKLQRLKTDLEQGKDWSHSTSLSGTKDD